MPKLRRPNKSGRCLLYYTFKRGKLLLATCRAYLLIFDILLTTPGRLLFGALDWRGHGHHEHAGTRRLPADFDVFCHFLYYALASIDCCILLKRFDAGPRWPLA